MRFVIYTKAEMAEDKPEYWAKLGNVDYANEADAQRGIENLRSRFRRSLHPRNVRAERLAESKAVSRFAPAADGASDTDLGGVM